MHKPWCCVRRKSTHPHVWVCRLPGNSWRHKHSMRHSKLFDYCVSSTLGFVFNVIFIDTALFWKSFGTIFCEWIIFFINRYQSFTIWTVFTFHEAHLVWMNKLVFNVTVVKKYTLLTMSAADFISFSVSSNKNENIFLNSRMLAREFLTLR